MRATLLGMVLGGLSAALVMVAADQPQSVFAQRQSGFDILSPSESLVVGLPGPASNGQQLVILVDREQQTMGSYQVDTQSGQISLRCVRQFRWDLQMDEFNGAEPSPEHIQALLRSR